MSQNNVVLSSLVDLVITDFIANNVLFTALDVSNKVKETMPMSRHREIRDEVRAAWSVTIEPNGYGRTPISVNLSDGSVVEALLYHPLSDSWDLDTKYDVQQRTKTSARPADTTASTTVTVGSTSISVSNAGLIVKSPSTSNQTSVVTPPVVTPPVAPVAPVAPVTNTIDLWNNLFQTQPSLFPRK